MKTFIVAVLLMCAGKATAQALLVPYEHYDTSGYFNPDSVKIDTNSASPTYLQMFGKRWFHVEFLYGSVLPLDSVRHDSNLVVSWERIDTTYAEVRASFAAIESHVGSFMLHKESPQFGDTNSII